MDQDIDRIFFALQKCLFVDLLIYWLKNITVNKKNPPVVFFANSYYPEELGKLVSWHGLLTAVLVVVNPFRAELSVLIRTIELFVAYWYFKWQRSQRKSETVDVQITVGTWPRWYGVQQSK